MATRRTVRWGGAALVLGTMATACGDGRPVAKTPPAKLEPAKPVQTEAREVRERITAHTCPARSKLAELLGHTPAAPAPDPEESADSAPPPTSTAGAARVAPNQTYRAVAPATVLVRTDNGMGTGVIFDARGYILTNYHVVAEGRKQDFVISVNVTLGDLTPTGRMSRREKTYEAVVVKADMIRDLAILKLKEPPSKLSAVKLAKTAPQIAERVMSVGHAGIGFLWAAKTCSVASIGERQHDTSRLAAFDCSNPDPALSPEEAKRYKERCDASKKLVNDALSATTQGLAVQTDCSITHGDSGGPLVNAVGELVGLNQSISADLATASFHIHVDELREFVSKFPDEGVALLPDPFCDGGADTTLEDVDLDGVVDTVVSKGRSGLLGGYDRISLLIDLDQNHLTRGSAKPGEVKDAGEMFDGEIALLRVRNTTYVWYDTDNDSRFDLVLVDKDNDGKPEQAYRIDASGRPKEDKDALPKHDLSAKYVKDPSLHARLGKIATAIGGTKYVSEKTLAASKESIALPDPLVAGGVEGRALDSDGNGKSDVAVLRGTFSRAVLIDADESSLGSRKPGEPVEDLVKARKIDPEVSLIVQGSSVWALYDTDNDAKPDLALMTVNGTDPTSFFASGAWRIGPKNELAPAPEHLGRKLLRPGLVSSLPRAALAMKALGADVASDEGLGSLPDPRLASRARFRVREVKGFPAGTMIEAQTLGAGAMLFDVDRDTKLPKPAKDAKGAKGAIDETDLQKVVSDGKFDAEVAVVHRTGPDGGSDYVFYDTDDDGKFDLVLFVPASGREPAQAYRVKPDGKLEADGAAVAGKMIRHKSVFKDKAIAAKWKAIASKAFRASSIEE